MYIKTLRYTQKEFTLSENLQRRHQPGPLGLALNSLIKIINLKKIPLTEISSYQRKKEWEKQLHSKIYTARTTMMAWNHNL
jgi:hypothetical protein